LQDNEKVTPDKNSQEILPPETSKKEGDSSPSAALLLAQISNYTNRPDLFLAEIEKHDPGFIKRMNKSAENHADKLQGSMFNFGRFQAYFALIFNSLMGCGLIAFIGWNVVKGEPKFWVIIALCIGFAITQGGTAGFSAITGAIAKAVGKGNISKSDAND
jgi:hypothetical protein